MAVNDSSEAVPELADAVPGAPRMGLRERKKAATMRRLQQIAVEQFEEHGFDAVTIEHIAEHAEVSPSTIYRYFGTKEALVLRDEFDEQVLAIAPVLLAQTDVFTAFERALGAVAGGHLAVPQDMAWRRTKVWMQTPSVRAAGYLVAEEMSQNLAAIAVEVSREKLSADDAYVMCSVAVMAVFAAIGNWYRGGGRGDMVQMALDAIRLVKPAAHAVPAKAAAPRVVQRRSGAELSTEEREFLRRQQSEQPPHYNSKWG